MLEILTAAEMKKADAAAIEGGVSGIQLMEAAGAAVADVVTRAYTPRPVLVLCGAGNNGGDGFIAATTLKKSGWPVRLACLVKKTALKGDALLAAKKWEGEVEALSSNLSVHKTELVIDAVFGTGLSKPLEPELVTLFDKIRTRKIPVVAVDIPSGIEATGGKVHTGTLAADITVTFARKKPAHVLLPARLMCGVVHTADIGIGDAVISALETQAFENHPALWLKDFPIPDAEAHKYDRGHAIVYAGATRPGAACLAAAAAQRIGAGAVTLAAHPQALQTCLGYRASLMVDPCAAAEDIKALLRDPRRNVAVIGPGAGEACRDLVLAALPFGKKMVLDADVFSAFAGDPQSLFGQLSPERHVLTPHAGEFSRLFGDSADDKITRARAAARKAQAVIVFKGGDTVIAAPDGTAIVNTNAPPTLATAGSGDVLAGLIAGIMAQGANPFMAAAAAVWLHGAAAAKHGLGLTPEDIIINISQTLNDLYLSQKSDS